MKILGLVGGVSWESTVVYYQLLNRGVRDRLGGRHSARLAMSSLDFAPIADACAEDRWDDVATLLIDGARQVEAAGAGAVLLCANTMHKVADEVQTAIGVPILHIADATAGALKAAGAARPLLLGTRYTMEMDFYRDRLSSLGVPAILPDAADRAELNRIIYDELVVGIVRDDSRDTMIGLIEKASATGADAVIFGCTELGLLATPDQSPLPVFDTAEIHVNAGLDWMLAG